MGRKSTQNMPYRAKFGKRLHKLTKEYVKKRNKEIKDYNKTAKKSERKELYSISKFCQEVCNEIPGDECTFTDQLLYKYKRDKNVPDNQQLVYELAKKLDASMEYLYGFEECRNIKYYRLKNRLSLDADSIKTLEKLSKNAKEDDLAIKFLNAILKDYDVCREMFTVFYEDMYEKYKRDSIGIPVDNQAIQYSIQRKIYTTEYYENLISRLLLVSEKDIFDKRIENEKEEEYYQKNNKEEVAKEVIEVSDLFNEINYEEPFTATEIQNNKNTKHSKSKRLR